MTNPSKTVINLVLQPASFMPGSSPIQQQAVEPSQSTRQPATSFRIPNTRQTSLL